MKSRVLSGGKMNGNCCGHKGHSVSKEFVIGI